MSSAKPPDGWDDIDPTILEMARMQRELYLAYLVSGFTETEASRLIASLWSSVGTSQSSAPEGS